MKQGAEYVLTGAKSFVLDGHIADKLIAAARTSGEPGSENGISLFLLEAGCQGLQIQRTQMVDSRNAANLMLDQSGSLKILCSVQKERDLRLWMLRWILRVSGLPQRCLAVCRRFSSVLLSIWNSGSSLAFGSVHRRYSIGRLRCTVRLNSVNRQFWRFAVSG